MGPSHRYDLIKEGDELKDELHSNHSIPIITPWWKILLYIILAASAGLGAALGIALASSLFKSSGSTAAAAAAANVTASTTLSQDLTLPTNTAIDQVEDKVNDPNSLAGKILDCGYSPEEARARGCVYDVMMQDWVPEPCYDSVLTERYLAQGNYTWYRDPEGNVMSDEEMRKGEHGDAWMTGSYHQAHCIFSWEKLIRAMRNNWPLSQELVSYDHVLHCRHQTLGGAPQKRDDGIAVRAPTNYAKCALYDTWITDLIPDKHSSTEK